MSTSLSIAVASRRPGTPMTADVHERVRSVCGVRDGGGWGEVRGGVGGPRVAGGADVVTIWPVGPAALLAALELVGREEGLVAAVWFELPNQRALATKRAVRRARAAPYGIVVGRGGGVPLTVAAGSLLTLHVALLRSRSPTQWRTIDARRRTRTANEAAAALGCTHQTVSRSLARSGYTTARRTRAALVALLELASAP